MPRETNFYHMLVKFAKSVYRNLKWRYLVVRSGGRVTRVVAINPADIRFGQKPESQFPAKRYYDGLVDGDWDLDVIPVEDHHIYQSYIQHFVRGKPWESTPLYDYAVNMIHNGVPFRGEYGSQSELARRFSKCDKLYESIKNGGYKSNKRLYKEGSIDNILDLLDEVTVNIARDGTMILNDGWHRFITARILEVPEIEVRICVQHKKSI